jgi:large subunit ribosomal protein L30
VSQITVKQKRSLIGQSVQLRKVVKSLGLRGINSSKTHKDNNCIRGMINKVKHLVSWELHG